MKGLKKAIQKGVALVDFTAPWCAPCHLQHPIVEKLAIAYQKKARIMVLDVEKDRQAAMQYNITSIPTIVIFKNGREIHRFVGLQPSDVLSSAIDKALDAGQSRYSHKAAVADPNLTDNRTKSRSGRENN